MIANHLQTETACLFQKCLVRRDVCLFMSAFNVLPERSKCLSPLSVFSIPALLASEDEFLLHKDAKFLELIH